MVERSASRTLSLLIITWSVPFDVFTKLYDSLAWPVIAYGAAIWGDRNFPCIDVVQAQSMGLYLGVAGDMGWKPSVIRLLKSTSNLWSRFSFMNNSRINKMLLLPVLIELTADVTTDNGELWTKWINMNAIVIQMYRNLPIQANWLAMYMKRCWSFFALSGQKPLIGTKVLETGKVINYGNTHILNRILKQTHTMSCTVKCCYQNRTEQPSKTSFRAGVTPFRVETGW